MERPAADPVPRATTLRPGRKRAMKPPAGSHPPDRPVRFAPGSARGSRSRCAAGRRVDPRAPSTRLDPRVAARARSSPPPSPPRRQGDREDVPPVVAVESRRTAGEHPGDIVLGRGDHATSAACARVPPTRVTSPSWSTLPAVRRTERQKHGIPWMTHRATRECVMTRKAKRGCSLAGWPVFPRRIATPWPRMVLLRPATRG